MPRLNLLAAPYWQVLPAWQTPDEHCALRVHAAVDASFA
jgi:hypothetical protein